MKAALMIRNVDCEFHILMFLQKEIKCHFVFDSDT